MGKRSATARSAPSRMNVQVDNGHVKTEPGEARIQEPSVTEWSDTGDPSAEAGAPADRVTPPANGDAPARTEAPKDDDDKQARIRKLLSNETPAAEEQTEDDPAPVVTDKPASEPTKPPTRRDMLANLGAERQKRSLEQQLKSERERAEKAERDRDEATKLLKDGDLLSFAKARGLTTDQAIDMLMNPGAEAAKPAAPVADPVNERLTRLEQRERDLLQREAMSRLEDETKELDIPVTRATARVAVTDGKGGTRIMSGRELVLATAQRLWEADGKPEGKQREYIKEAAPLVEEQLIADDKDRFEAYAKKNGGGTKPAVETKPAATKKPPVPSVGSRSGGATAKVEEPELPEDPDERRQAIKLRNGW